jgi:D-amino peptidase
MVNIHVDDLPEYVEIVRGFPRPLSMVAGVESCDVALFLGYHAKFGTAKSTFDHTYSSASINRVEINGVAASEFLLNGYVAGEFKVPVILVAGEAQLLKDDVKQYAPWAETVAMKQSLSRLSAKSPSLSKVEIDLRKAVRKSVLNYRRGKTQLLQARRPVKTNVTFIASHFADIAEMLPTGKRTGAFNVEYTSENMTEAYKTFELLVLAASGGSAIMESLR